MRAIILEPHDGCLALARRLTRRGVSVLVLSNASSSWVARSRGVEGIELPALGGAQERWLEQLAELGADDGVLLSGSDRATALLVEHRAEIPASLRLFESADSAHARLMDKATLYEEAKKAGIRYPWSRLLSSEEDLERASGEAEYPCLLKPTMSHLWRSLFGRERVFVIDSPDALAEKARPAIAAGLSLLLNEHVPGPETNLEGHVALRLADGTYALEYTRRKLRQYPLDFGAGAILESMDAPLTGELSRRLLDSSGFVGLAAVEAKIHAETGEPVLIEVNVRLPQSFGLGDAAGVNAAYRVYSVLAGLPLGPQPPMRAGAKVVVPALEFRAARERLRRGDIGWREPARELPRRARRRRPQPARPRAGACARRAARALARRRHLVLSHPQAVLGFSEGVFDPKARRLASRRVDGARYWPLALESANLTVSGRSISTLVCATLADVGTSTASSRAVSLSQHSGKYKRASISETAVSFASAAKTPTWLFSTFPSRPFHCRATPAEASPFFTNALSSMRRAAFTPPMSVLT